jgi:hypothetical protein
MRLPLTILRLTLDTHQVLLQFRTARCNHISQLFVFALNVSDRFFQP